MKNFLKKLRIDKQILWIVVIALLFFLVMSFNTRVSELLRLNADRDTIATNVANLKATEQTLKNQIAYATSDVAVEEWARTQGHMIREGDYPIVPIVPAKETPQPKITPQPTPEPVENWQVWQALFFGH
jgi:cell division protein FtsB